MTLCYFTGFSRLSAALLMSTALGGAALAQSLPEISPEQIAQDVERRTDSRTGETQYIGGSFDPFEADPLLAGSASLRSTSGATAINGQYVSGGALLDVSMIYTANSADSFDVRGFETARFHSGQPISIVRYDRETLDCARNTSVITYDDSYYRGASYGYLAGLHRLYPRYRGHRHFGWNQGSWNRNVFGGRYVDYGDFRRRGARRIFRDNHNGIDREDRDRDRGERRHRDREDGSRRDRNRDRYIGRDADNRERARDRSEARERRRNRNENDRTRNRDRRENSEGQPRPQREDRTARQNRENQGRNNAGRNRDSRPENNNRWRRGENRGNAAGNTRAETRQSTPAPQAEAPRAARPARVDSPPSSRPARTSTPRAARQERKSRPAVNRAVDRSFERSNSAPKSRGQKVRRFYPSHYVREEVSVSYRCVKEEKLTLHIPQERIDAARFDGFAVMIIDNSGQEVPVFIPPNYVEGFRQAAGLNRSQNSTPQSTPIVTPPGRYIQPQTQPVPRASSRTPIIYGNLD